MNNREMAMIVVCLFRELLDGPPPEASYMLNRGDVGMLRSLDALTHEQASEAATGRPSVAAHVDHVRYGLSLLNRWMAGDDPFDTADWTASWRRTSVSDAQWQELRAELEREALAWMRAVQSRGEMSVQELKVTLACLAHLAYHLGAIRQIERAASGPHETPRAD